MMCCSWSSARARIPAADGVAASWAAAPCARDDAGARGVATDEGDGASGEDAEAPPAASRCVEDGVLSGGGVTPSASAPLPLPPLPSTCRAIALRVRSCLVVSRTLIDGELISESAPFTTNCSIACVPGGRMHARSSRSSPN